MRLAPSLPGSENTLQLMLVSTSTPSRRVQRNSVACTALAPLAT